MSDALQLLEPWHPVPTAGTDDHARELYREVRPGHPLHNAQVRTRAVRGDNDDVLFEIQGGSARFAVVHLSWRGSGEPPPWPHTTFYATFEDWIEDGMKPDHLERMTTD